MSARYLAKVEIAWRASFLVGLGSPDESPGQSSPKCWAGVSPEPEVMEKLAAEITYRLRAPIEAMKNDSINAIIEAIKKTPISLTFEDLLAAAPAVQKDRKELVTKRRVKVSAAAPTQVFEQKE